MNQSQRRNYCLRGVLPFASMVVASCTTVGSNTFFKAVASKELSYHIFILYTYAIAALVALLLSYIFRRKAPLPPLTISIVFKFLSLGALGEAPLPPLTIGIVFKFLSLGALGFVTQNLGNIGIKLSSPTLSSAMSNLTPAATFILAILFRMEKIELLSSSSQAKILGTMLSISGAFVAVLYTRPVVVRSRARDVPPASISLHDHQVAVQSNWIAGGAALAAEYSMVSIWYTYQSKVIREYPAEMVLVFFYNVACFILSLVVCLITEPDFEAWKVKPDVRLFSILYAGTLGTGLTILIHTWILHIKGPVYVALFLPMSIVIAAIMGLIFLGDALYLGCIIGSVIIALGFYATVWGKAKEEIGENPITYADVESLPSSSVSLLNEHTKK